MNEKTVEQAVKEMNEAVEALEKVFLSTFLLPVISFINEMTAKFTINGSPIPKLCLKKKYADKYFN